MTTDKDSSLPRGRHLPRHLTVIKHAIENFHFAWLVHFPFPIFMDHDETFWCERILDPNHFANKVLSGERLSNQISPASRCNAHALIPTKRNIVEMVSPCDSTFEAW